MAQPKPALQVREAPNNTQYNNTHLRILRELERVIYVNGIQLELTILRSQLKTTNNSLL